MKLNWNRALTGMLTLATAVLILLRGTEYGVDDSTLLLLAAVCGLNIALDVLVLLTNRDT